MNFIFLYLPWVISFVLLLASIYFVRQFCLPSRRLNNELRIVIRNLEKIKNGLMGAPITDLDGITVVMISNELKHLWSEFTETLHPQKREDNSEQLKVVCYRATAMAEIFFSEQALLETQLKTAFYKHLPGILTGLGIIGTFSGLIYGLSHFDISTDAAKMAQELRNLFIAVGSAFTISAVAISLAMLCTWWTNRELTLRYKQVERLCQLIDSFFDAGVGEEYLARLVEASETSATQSIHLKEALVTDLKEILTELTNRQIQEMSSGIGKSFADSMREPMDRISKAVEGVGVSQGDAVNKMLTDVLSDFSARIEKMFGGQLHGINELLTQTSQAMQETARQFGEMANKMGSAGESAAQAMADQLGHAMTSMESRQTVMNEQMGEFVEQIRLMVNQSQTESAQKLQETVGQLGTQVADIIGQLREASSVHTAAQETVITNLSGQVETLIAQLLITSADLSTNVSALTSMTTSAIDRLNSGAETLVIAADDFAKAGQGVVGTMNASADATKKMQSSAQSFSTATESIQQIFTDYRRTSDALATMLADLKITIESAKKEAGLTTQLVDQLKVAAEHLGQAQNQADNYLQSVNRVLSETHLSFANEIANTLRTGNATFQQELSTAVGLLRNSIQELGDTLDELPTGKA